MKDQTSRVILAMLMLDNGEDAAAYSALFYTMHKQEQVVGFCDFFTIDNIR